MNTGIENINSSDIKKKLFESKLKFQKDMREEDEKLFKIITELKFTGLNQDLIKALKAGVLLGLSLYDFSELFKMSHNCLVNWLLKGKEQVEEHQNLTSMEAVLFLEYSKLVKKFSLSLQEFKDVPCSPVRRSVKKYLDIFEKDALILDANFQKLERGDINIVEYTFSQLRKGKSIPPELQKLLPKLKIDPPINMQERYTEEELEQETLETYEQLLYQKEVEIPERQRQIAEMKRKLNEGDEYLDQNK